MGGPYKLRKIISEKIVLQEVGKILLEMERRLLYDSFGSVEVESTQSESESQKS